MQSRSRPARIYSAGSDNTQVMYTKCNNKKRCDVLFPSSVIRENKKTSRLLEHPDIATYATEIPFGSDISYWLITVYMKVVVSLNTNPKQKINTRLPERAVFEYFVY